MPFKGLKTLQKFPWTFPASLHGLGEIIKASPCIPYVEVSLSNRKREPGNMRVSLVKYPQYLKKKSKGQKSKEKHSKSIEPRPVVLCLWKHSCSFHRRSEPWVVESASLYWFQRFSNGVDIWNNELIMTGVKIQTPLSLSSPPCLQLRGSTPPPWPYSGTEFLYHHSPGIGSEEMRQL